jgi:hypothetical protein
MLRAEFEPAIQATKRLRTYDLDRAHWDRHDGFLRAIIRGRTSFGGEVKPSAPCRKILRYVK